MAIWRPLTGFKSQIPLPHNPPGMLAGCQGRCEMARAWKRFTVDGDLEIGLPHVLSGPPISRVHPDSQDSFTGYDFSGGVRAALDRDDPMERSFRLRSFGARRRDRPASRPWIAGRGVDLRVL